MKCEWERVVAVLQWLVVIGHFPLPISACNHCVGLVAVMPKLCFLSRLQLLVVVRHFVFL